jgi:hypothetical protein
VSTWATSWPRRPQRGELAEVQRPRTLHLGPDHHVDLDIHAHADVTAAQLGELLMWLEHEVHDADPQVQRVSIRLV